MTTPPGAPGCNGSLPRSASLTPLPLPDLWSSCMHSCYQTDILLSPDPSAPLISSCSSVTSGYPSLFSSLPSPLPEAWLRMKCGSRAITLHSSMLQVSSQGVRCPTHPHLLSFLHTAHVPANAKPFSSPILIFHGRTSFYWTIRPSGLKF